MIKGCQKKIIFLKNTGSTYFDEAYFVIKPSAIQASEGDIVLEATKIANSISSDPPKEKARGKMRSWLAFLLGVALGGGIMLMIHLLI